MSDQPYHGPAPWPGQLAELDAAHPARRAVEIAAAGAHHLALIGDGPGRLPARRLHSLLPDLDPGTAAQLERSGLPPVDPAHRRPPWQTLHPTRASGDAAAREWCRQANTLLGGRHHPGAAALAHRGVLYCEDFADLAHHTVNALVAILQDRRVLLRGARWQVDRPADLQLVAASTGCPDGGRDRCACPPLAHQRHLGRAARLLDRVDIRAGLPPAGLPAPPGPDTAPVATLVSEARAAAAKRWTRLGEPYTVNAHATTAAMHAAIRAARAVPTTVLAPLRHAVDVGALSARGARGALRVAWTIADLAGAPAPTPEHVTEALAWRTGPT